MFGVLTELEEKIDTVLNKLEPRRISIRKQLAWLHPINSNPKAQFRTLKCCKDKIAYWPVPTRPLTKHSYWSF